MLFNLNVKKKQTRQLTTFRRKEPVVPHSCMVLRGSESNFLRLLVGEKSTYETTTSQQMSAQPIEWKSISGEWIASFWLKMSFSWHLVNFNFRVQIKLLKKCQTLLWFGGFWAENSRFSTKIQIHPKVGQK